MKKTIFFTLIATVSLLFSCQPDVERTNVEALISTEFGEIKVRLSDETPIHRDNFIQQVESGFYEGASFFKFMPGYMVMAGHGQQNSDANLSADESVQAELNGLQPETGKLHFRGALAAPRIADANRSSDGNNFYIVTGQYNIIDVHLDRQQQLFKFEYTPEQRDRYKQQGGYPFLDGDHTVFGEVIAGLNFAESILRERKGKDKIPMTVKILN